MGTHPSDKTVDRRGFLASTAAGAAVMTAAPAAFGKLAQGAGLKAGATLGGGWLVSEIRPIEAGAVRIIVEHAATERGANVAVCRAEAGSGAIASTGAVDLFLMNDGGDGKSRTPADEVALVRHLARQLNGAEETLPGAVRLLGRSERLNAYDPIDHLNPTNPTT
ncbi:MAG: hypothetical protein QF464_11340 [Myxococcota bacterium]|nr:hypothetical protein [Myxococcota bacterium]